MAVIITKVIYSQLQLKLSVSNITIPRNKIIIQNQFDHFGKPKNTAQSQ